MSMTFRASIAVSAATIVVVQLLSLLALASVMVRDIDRKASVTADEVRDILTEPLFRVDDSQAIRIGEALLSSGSVAGIRIEAEPGGAILDRPPGRASPWIPPQRREIEYEGFRLGSLVLYLGDSDLERVIGTFVAAMVAIVAAVLGASYYAYRRLIYSRVRSVEGKLKAGIGEIASGRYDRGIERTGYPDMDAIIDLINDMADKVSAKGAELREANDELERRVAERTVALEAALDEQRVLQVKLVESGKLATLGQLSSGLAHALNTPLGALLASTRVLADFFDRELPGLLALRGSLLEPERLLFEAAADRALREGRSLEIKPPRPRAAEEVARRLAEAGLAEGAAIAEVLVDSGLDGGVEEMAPLMRTGRGAQVLAAAASLATARRMIEVALRSAEKASAAVSALSPALEARLSRIEEAIDLGRSIGRAVEMAGDPAMRDVRLRVEPSRVSVRGSPEALSLVWMHLVRNAAQAMGYRGEIAVRAERSGGKAVVHVIDSGPGIPEEDKDRVFAPLFTTKKAGEGLGLGLAACKRIVEAHGGTIGFESRPGRTDFIVTLPAAGEGPD